MKKRQALKGPNPFVYGSILLLVRFLFKVLFRMSFRRDPRIGQIPGPLFIVGNHAAYFDPMVCAAAFPRRRIRFVSGAEVANTKALRALIRRFSVIEIRPFHVNFSTTREIIGSIAAGHPVALYPEAQRSMAGGITPFGPETAKLIRHLKVPVAAAICHGAYLAWPRWTKIFRPGKIEVETRLLFTAEETVTLPLETIQERLVRAMDADDYSWQKSRKRPARYSSRKRAERLSAVCHWCPSCDRPLAMKSEKNKLFCSHCSLSLRLDATGFFSASPGSPAPFDHPLEFAGWQRARLQEAAEEGQVFSTACRLSFLDNVGKGEDPARQERPGTLSLTPEGLSFRDDETGEMLEFDLGDSPALYCSPGRYVNLLHNGIVWRAYPEAEGFALLLTDRSRIIWTANNDFDRYLEGSPA